MNYNGLQKYHCPLSLEKKVRNQIVDSLTPVAIDAFGTDMTREDVENHVIPVSTLLVSRNSEEVKGFSAYKTFNFEDYAIVYGVGASVLRSEQGKGLYRRFNEEGIKVELRKNASNKFYFAARTQNPVIYASLRKMDLIEKVYPNEEKTPHDIEEIAEKIANILGGQIDKNFVMKNAYGKCLYDEVQRYKDEEVNNMFDSLLSYEKGDALLIIGKLK